ncbi:MAG: ribosome-associated translation inhibitor RaiA [Cytophagales bacterium]|nr:MAG: ribosome-associated translation inhibitor RaiA [Cytophagales bacterium]
MKLNIQSIHFDADQKLLEFIEKKAAKLDTFHEKIIDGEVFLKVDKDSQQENKIVEIKVNIPGHHFFVKEKSKSFEAATDEAVETLKLQIKKHKEKVLMH